MPIPLPITGTPTLNSVWAVDIDADLVTFAGDWKSLNGITSFDPGYKTNPGDNSDFDTPGGWAAQANLSRAWEPKATVRRNRYGVAQTFDDGQEILRSVAVAADMNQLVHVRYYQRIEGGEAWEGYALVQWQDKAGPRDQNAEADIMLLGQGERFAVTNPYDAGAIAPVVAAVSPTGGAAAGGNLVTINGSGFVGVTSVKFGATTAGDYSVQDSGRIVAIAPAHATGIVDVTVTTAGGTSATSTATKYTYA